jgi:hypothetical protein
MTAGNNLACKLAEQLDIPADARGPAHVRVFVEGPKGSAVGVVNVSLRPTKKVEESANRAEPAAR